MTYKDKIMKQLFQNDIDRLKFLARNNERTITIPIEDFEALIDCYEDPDDIKELKEEIKDQQSLVNKLEDRIEEINERVSELDSENDSLQDKVDGLEEDLANNGVCYEASEVEVERLLEENKKLMADLDKLTGLC